MHHRYQFFIPTYGFYDNSPHDSHCSQLNAQAHSARGVQGEGRFHLAVAARHAAAQLSAAHGSTDHGSAAHDATGLGAADLGGVGPGVADLGATGLGGGVLHAAARWRGSAAGRWVQLSPASGSAHSPRHPLVTKYI